MESLDRREGVERIPARKIAPIQRSAAPAFQDRRVVRAGVRRSYGLPSQAPTLLGAMELPLVMIPQLLRHDGHLYDWMTESVIQSYGDTTADTARRVIPDATARSGFDCFSTQEAASRSGFDCFSAQDVTARSRFDRFSA
jgi:hypothetical protein